MPKVAIINIKEIFYKAAGHPMPKEKIDVKPHPENTPPKPRRPRS